jgi:purine-nucleoside phosphorylase
MPARLRPTAPIAPAALLVGDPGRALALAQELLGKPLMSNHARGLWGYSGESLEGRPLTIQSTGMGGPSAAVVLADLAELGVRRAVRVGTCTALRGGLAAGALVAVGEAHAWSGPGGGAGEAIAPEPELAERLREALGDAARPGTVASLDVLHGGGAPPPVAEGDVADMQTAALLAAAARLGIAAAAVLIVSEGGGGERLGDEGLEAAAKVAGAAAAAVL